MEQRPKSVLIMKRLRKRSHRLIGGVGASSEGSIRSQIDDVPQRANQPGRSQCCQQLGISVTTALQDV